MILNKYSIDELVEVGANSFAYGPNTPEEIDEILTYNDGRLLPVLLMNAFSFNNERGIWEIPDFQAIKESVRGRQVVWLLDEPAWHIRMACWNGKQEACNEIEQDYPQLRKVVETIKVQLSAQIMSIEAYQEIKIQTAERGSVMNLVHVDIVGFDCYGDVNKCHGWSMMDYGIAVYLTMREHQKMIVVPGGYSYADEQAVVDGLEWFREVSKIYPELITHFGVFVWDDFQESGNYYSGARNLPHVRSTIERIFNELSN